MSLFGKKYSEANNAGQYFVIGRVKSIVLGPYKGNTKELDPNYTSNGDIGKITYQLLYHPLGSSFSEGVSQPAWPMAGFIKQYPLLNEIVMIMMGPSPGLNDSYNNQQSFYFPPFGLWNDSNHNGFPDMDEYASFIKKFSTEPGYQGGDQRVSNFPLGYTFQEKEDIRNLKPFEGDVILQARFGQSVRFGSTVTALKKETSWSDSGNNGDPVTIILNEQGSRTESNKFATLVENINRDGSAIYMTSTQEIRLNLLGFPLKSFDIDNIDPIKDDVVYSREIPVSDEYISADNQDRDILKS